MMTLWQIKDIAARSRNTLLQDAVGGLALMVILMVFLHLPTFV
ncbi:MAG: hypothetical protein AAGF27_09770 [Pseudomonadota bacterium]